MHITVIKLGRYSHILVISMCMKSMLKHKQVVYKILLFKNNNFLTKTKKIQLKKGHNLHNILSVFYIRRKNGKRFHKSI